MNLFALLTTRIYDAADARCFLHYAIAETKGAFHPDLDGAAYTDHEGWPRFTPEQSRDFDKRLSECRDMLGSSMYALTLEELDDQGFDYEPEDFDV